MYMCVCVCVFLKGKGEGFPALKCEWHVRRQMVGGCTVIPLHRTRRPKIVFSQCAAVNL